MKRILLFLFVLTVTLMGTFDLALADIPVEELVFTEDRAPRVDVTQQGQKLQFEVSGNTYSVDVFPKLEAMKMSLGLKLPPEIIAQLKARGEPIPEETNPLEAYRSLPEDLKKVFLAERVQFLKKVAVVLQTTSYVTGMGSLAVDRITLVGRKMKQAMASEQYQTTDPRAELTYKEAREKSVQSMLQSIDYKLWYQAPLFIDRNEFGLQAHLGIVAVRGFRKHGSGGAEFLGLSLGYNRTLKALVFEVYHNSESFDNSKAAVGMLGLNFFAGPFVSHRDTSAPAKTLKGFSFYPPFAPGGTQYGSDIFSPGVASGLGLPPPPIGDMFTWTDRFERRTVVRVTVSAILPGFVRLHVGDVKGSVQMLVVRVSDALVTLARKILPLQRRSCGVVFATTSN